MNKQFQIRPPVVRLPPKSNFEIVLTRGSQMAIIWLGMLGVVFALVSGKFILAPFFLAVVVGLMLGPLASVLERLGIHPWISAAIVVLIFLASVFALAFALVTPLSYWAGRLPQMWDSLRDQLSQFRAPLELVRGVRDEIREATGSEGLTVSVEEGLPVTSIAFVAPAVGTQILIFFASLYFFVATRAQTRAAILRLCIKRKLRWRVAHIFRDVEALVSRYLLSITAINVGLALAVTLALWSVGVPQPALWGALAGLLNFIIYIGPAMMFLILFAVGLATYDTLSGSLMPPMIYMAVNVVEAQFVTPMVIGRTMTLNPFVVFLALAFWIWIWGPIGGFVAIPALLILIAITRNILPGWELSGIAPQR